MVVINGEADIALYPYNPSAVAPWTFLVLWGIAALAHFILMFPYRAAFPIPLIIGCIAEIGAYYFRTRSHDNVHKILPFVFQGLLILAAPPFIAATMYMSLGRIIRALKAEDYTLISAKWLTKIFVLIDLVCLGSQLAGSVLSASETPSEAQTGQNVIRAGLILQVVIFILFILLMLHMHVRIRRDSTAVVAGTGLAWQRYLWMLYALSTIFLVRNIVRIVEYQQGDKGFIVTHESMLYVFDGGFMLAIVYTLAVIHPGRLVRQARSVAKGWMVENEMQPLA